MIKLALIGVGRWGGNILRTLTDVPGVSVIPITRAGQPVPDDIAGVLIATPGSTHAQVALPFIKQGLPIFIEKPMTTSLADAKQLARAAKQSGSSIVIGHIHLYNPAYLKLKSLVPKIGGIRLIHFEGMAPGPARDDMSVLWDWGPHGVSMAVDLLDEQPRYVQAWGQKVLNPRRNLHDTVQARLLFSRGVEATFSLSWVNPEKRVRLTVIGTGGSIVFDDTQPSPKTTAGKAATGKVSLYADNRVIHPRYSSRPPLTRELAAFVRMVTSKQGPVNGAEEGIDVVRVLAAAEKSLHRGGQQVSATPR
jgi:UDP-N-acetylglucosamine 3-dehydrogenase